MKQDTLCSTVLMVLEYLEILNVFESFVNMLQSGFVFIMLWPDEPKKALEIFCNNLVQPFMWIVFGEALL